MIIPPITEAERLQERIRNMHSYDRRRAEAMGFEFGDPTVKDGWGSFVVEGSFTCVCGKREFYKFILDSSLRFSRAGATDEMIDPWLKLRSVGSFSKKHLLADGYDPAEVDRIIDRGNAFDRANTRNE